MKGTTMSTLPPCADGFNDRGDEPDEIPADYSTRPSGHPDEGTDLGDDAVNADAAMAEAKLRLVFPEVEAVVIVREQERFASKTFWTEFITRWRVRLSGSHSATGLTLDAAVDALVAQAKPSAAALPPG
jgi:hypothetical protein